MVDSGQNGATLLTPASDSLFIALSDWHLSDWLLELFHSTNQVREDPFSTTDPLLKLRDWNDAAARIFRRLNSTRIRRKHKKDAYLQDRLRGYANMVKYPWWDLQLGTTFFGPVWGLGNEIPNILGNANGQAGPYRAEWMRPSGRALTCHVRNLKSDHFVKCHLLRGPTLRMNAIFRPFLTPSPPLNAKWRHCYFILWRHCYKYWPHFDDPHSPYAAFILKVSSLSIFRIQHGIKL